MTTDAVDLEGEELYHYAQQQVGTSKDVVTGRISGESYVIGEDVSSVVPVHERPLDAALELLDVVWIAPLWHDQSVTAVLTQGTEYRKMDFLRPYFGELTEGFTTDDGHEHKDGFIFRESDYQRDQHGIITARWAEENPETYVEVIADSDPVLSCRLLGEEKLKGMGFTAAKDFENGMYRASRRDDPGEIRETIEEDHGPSTEVLFTVDDYFHPFETTGTVYVRTADVPV
jgi:hypothetical protein